MNESSKNDKFAIRPLFAGDVKKLDTKSDCFEKSCIGYLRGDFGRKGSEFWTTWWPNHVELNSPAFKNVFYPYVNWLKYTKLLKNFKMMTEYCSKHPEAELHFPFEPSFGFKTVTEEYTFYLRCIPRANDYNFYIFCYTNLLADDVEHEVQDSTAGGID